MLEIVLSSQLFSVVVGACLTLIISVIMSKKNVSSSLDQQISKERIDTYKKIYRIICQLNHHLSYATDIKAPKECFLGYIKAGTKEYHKGYCFPTVFYSYDTFNKYKVVLSNTINNNRLFLDQEITNKLSFLDSYLGEIWHLIHEKDDSYLHMIGYALSNEISELSQDIETDIQCFINKGNKKRVKNSFFNTYHYEYEKVNTTELKCWFLNNDIVRFGDFPLCKNCQYCENCPLNTILEQEKE